MAEPTPGRSEKARLIAEIEDARSSISRDVQVLSRAADIPTKVIRGFRSAPGKVAAGTALLGFVSSFILPRNRRARPARHRSLAEKALAFMKKKLTESGSPAPTGAATEPGDELSRRLARAVRAVRNALK